MKKWLIIVLLIAAVPIILLLAVVGSLGPLITYAVNTYGPALLHTPVRLGGCSVSLFSGSAELRDFVLKNPSGFSKPDAIRVASLSLRLDLWSLMRDTIVIRHIDAEKPDIAYEKKAGTDNFKVLLSAFAKDAAGEPSDKSARTSRSRSGNVKKLLINDLIISSGSVTLNLPQTAGRDITVPLPSLHLKNIGSETGGASPAAVGTAILKALYAEITSPGISGTIDRVLGIAGAQAERAGEGVKKGVDALKRTFKKIFEK